MSEGECGFYVVGRRLRANARKAPDSHGGSGSEVRMHVITRKRLNDFASRHPDRRSALAHWYRLIKGERFSSFVDLKRVFASADQVGKFTVFNVGGNKVRLVAAIHYNRGKVYIRHVLTHEEYDRGQWKEK